MNPEVLLTTVTGTARVGPAVLLKTVTGECVCESVLYLMDLIAQVWCVE